MSWGHYIVLGVVAFMVTFALMPSVIRFAFRHDVVDHPGGRRINKSATPRLGGVGIAAGMAAALAVQLIGELIFDWGGPFYLLGSFDWTYVGIASGLVFMFLTGLVDDFVSLRPSIKLAGQIIAALMVALSGVTINSISDPWAVNAQISLGYASIPLTVLYLVAFANVMNLIDGLDGLASGVAVISTISLLLLAVGNNRMDAGVLAVALIGACLAFLRYNFNPASIFMGDSGSLTLGFSIGVISLLGVTRSTAAIGLIVPIIIVGVPVIDTATAIVRRLKEHQPIQQADGRHIHHKLLNQGFGQRKTVLIIYAWSSIMSVGGFLVAQESSATRLAIFIMLVAASLIIAWRLGLLTRSSDGEEP